MQNSCVYSCSSMPELAKFLLGFLPSLVPEDLDWEPGDE